VLVRDDLRIILDAEADVRRQFDAAREQAGQLVRQAEDEVQQQLRAAHDAYETEVAAVEARIVAEAEQQSKRIRATAEATAAAMHSQAATRMDRAVAALVDGVLAPETEESDDGG
jgi:vacuolar-type H+-ATPase subunit H